METNERSRRFTEEQLFPVWAYVILAAVGVISAATVTAATRRLAPGMIQIAVFALATNLLYLRTQITQGEIVLTFGALFPLYRRRIALADIASAESVTYSPLAEYGGWGIRGWGRNVALNAQGDRGVRLTLRDGRRILIGSQQPERLKTALETGEGQGL